MRSEWIDVSVPLRTGMVHWPGNPPVIIERRCNRDRGDSSNVSVLSLGSHTGTHMDAPAHFIDSGATIDQAPFSAVIGQARVIEIKDTESIKASELKSHRIRRGEKILFKTRNSKHCWKTDVFAEDFVYLSTEAAEFLARSRIQTIGMDYLSIAGSKNGGHETHRTLLESGIWIIEGLDLSRIRPGKYDLICLPLRIAGGDGAPSRALLRRR